MQVLLLCSFAVVLTMLVAGACLVVPVDIAGAVAEHGARKAHRCPSSVSERRGSRCPREVSCNQKVKAFSRGEQWQQALSMLDDMQQARITTDVVSFAVTLEACKQGVHWEASMPLLDQIEKNAKHLKNRAWSNLLYMRLKCMQWTSVLDSFDDMERYGLTYRPFDFDISMAACNHLRQWQRALSLFDKMQQHGLTPSAVTLEVSLDVPVGPRQWQRALSVLEGMSPNHENAAYYEVAIKSCDYGVQWERALSILSDIQKAGVTPSYADYNIAFVACETGKQHDRAGMLLDLMRASSLAPRTTSSSSSGIMSSSLNVVNIKAIPHAALPGQFIVKDFVTPEEESKIIAFLDGDGGDQPDWKFTQPNGPAFRKRFGVLMNIKSREFWGPLHPIPQVLLPIAKRLRSIVDGPVMEDFRPNECNAIDLRRQLGHYLGAHCDDRYNSGQILCSLSLAGSATMVFEKSQYGSIDHSINSRSELPFLENQYEVHLPRRSLHIQTGVTRFDYNHGIPNEKLFEDRRVSVTFRQNSFDGHNV